MLTRTDESNKEPAHRVFTNAAPATYLPVGKLRAFHNRIPAVGRAAPADGYCQQWLEKDISRFTKRRTTKNFLRINKFTMIATECPDMRQRRHNIFANRVPHRRLTQ